MNVMIKRLTWGGTKFRRNDYLTLSRCHDAYSSNAFFKTYLIQTSRAAATASHMPLTWFQGLAVLGFQQGFCSVQVCQFFYTTFQHSFFFFFGASSSLRTQLWRYWLMKLATIAIISNCCPSPPIARCPSLPQHPWKFFLFLFPPPPGHNPEQ